MKCYIGTYYKYNNYGTRLQNFALSSVLKSNDIEPVTIYLKDSLSFKMILKKIAKQLYVYLPVFSEKKKILLNETKKNKIFNEFNKNLNLLQIKSNDLNNLEMTNSFCIAGSDQIWSPTHLKNNMQDINLFFFDFAPYEKRFAFAPSFGVDEIPKELRELYTKKLNGFKKLSVRENKGKEIILSLINKDVPIMPDPVFLLTKEEWKQSISYNNNFNIKKPYLLTYFLGVPNDDVIKEIKKVCEIYNYQHINISGNHYNEFDIIPNPIEFVGLIDEADFVITDSFHASAFSIIMETNFVVLKRTDVKQFSRIETLLKKYNAETCYMELKDISNLRNQILKTSHINREKLYLERERGLKFISEIIKEGGTFCERKI